MARRPLERLLERCERHPEKKKDNNGGKSGGKPKQAADSIPRYDAECWEVGSPSGLSRPTDAANAGL